MALFKKERPDWVDKGIGKKYPVLSKLKDIHLTDIKRGWPDISTNSKNGVLQGKFDTFDASMRASEIAPGDKLYRVVDPGSGDNRICWMREGEFSALTSKSDWRRRFAVWKSWNENGEYIVYTVPP